MLIPIRPPRKALRYSRTWKRARSIAGHPDLMDLSALDHASVAHADNPADTDRPFGVLVKGTDGLEESVPVEDGVGVDRAEQRIAGDIEPGVHGVRLFSVDLVHDDQLGFLGRHIYPAGPGPIRRTSGRPGYVFFKSNA